jgi:exopolysaccharide biosynthesis WecB/TagA/CpsF family protein
MRILNIDIHQQGFGEFVSQLDSGLVVTPNVDHLMKLQRDREFYNCYRSAEHVVCDSRIVQFASRFLDPANPIPEKISGSDLLPAWCRHHGQRSAAQTLFLLGGSEQSVGLAGAHLNRLAGREMIVGVYSPPFGFEQDMAECQRIIDQVNQSGATALAVGVGAPKQEIWICRHRQSIPNVHLFFAVGATIEFLSGSIKRAPGWMSRLGLEWLHRLMQEPGRLTKRYLVDDLPFFWLILKQKMGRYSNPWDEKEF